MACLHYLTGLNSYSSFFLANSPAPMTSGPGVWTKKDLRTSSRVAPGLKRKMCQFLIILLLPLFGLSQTLINYPAPKGSPLNDDFTVKVRSQGKEWQNIPVYLVKVDQVIGTRHTPQSSSAAYFDFSGTVEIAVTYNKGKIESSRVRPLSYGINSSVSGKTIYFSLSQPRNLSIEVNGDIFHNLQILANPIETNRPDSKDTNVIYYAPGIHYIGRAQVGSGKTVYIAGGAVVQGQLLVSNAQNVKILGRGILYQSPTRLSNPDSLKFLPSPFIASQPRGRRGRADIITVEYSTHVEINGILIVPTSYTVLVGQSKDVEIRNIKSFSAGGNNDGLDIFCSSDVTVDNVFMRNSDDCIAIYGHRWGYYGNLKNVTVKNSVLWADVAHPILIGTHGDSANPDTLENLTFSNIDVLDHNESQINYQGCMSINAGDDNMIRNVRFENFNIEDIRQGQLVNMRVMFNKKYNTSAGRSIENIYFKNITYNGSRANLSIIAGYDDSLRSIKNVTFENLRINGTLITDTMKTKPAWFQTADMAKFFVGEHVTGLQFIAPAGGDAAKVNQSFKPANIKTKQDE